MANEVFLGSVYATLELRDKEWKDKLDESANEIDKLENKVNNKMASVGAGFKSAGQALSVGLTAPILAVGTAITLSAATFDKQMSSIKALTGATGKEMETLRKLALQAGAETAFSAKEAAQGIEELLKAGVSTTDVLNGGLYAALNLATAGDLQLAEAAEIASTALNAFKADNLSVADAANILAGAANASATDVHELRYALAASSAVASAIGISFKDTNTALAVFAQNGLKGSDAGTSLKTMLLNLQPTTEKQISLFQTLGLMTADGANQFFTAEGKAKSLADISGVLQKSLGGLSDQERLLALEMLFGSDAIRAANILYKEGEKGLTDMSSAMGKVTAADVAKEKLNNLSGSVEQFKGSVETASINLGEFTQGPLKALVDFGTNAVNSFNSINPAIQQFILIIGGILAAIGPVLIGIGFLIDAIAKIGAAFAFVQGTAFAASLAGIGAVLGPLLPIILGIAAAVGLMYLFFDTIKGPINDFLGLLGLVNGEGTKTVSTFDLIGQFFSALGTAIMTALADPLRRIADLWRQLGEALAPLAPLLPPIGEALKVVGAVVGGVLVGAFVLFLGILTAVVSAIISVIGGIVQFFTGITQVVTGFFGWLIAIFTGNTQQAQELWNQMGQGIYNTFSGFIKVITLGIGQFVKTIIAFFQSLYMTLVGGSIVPDMITAIIGWFFQLPGAVGSAVVSMITAAVNGFNNLWNNIVSTVSKWPGMLYDWGRKIIQSFVDGIASMAGAVVSAITNVLDKAKGLVKGNSPPPEGPFKHIDQWGFNVGMAWSDGLTSAIGSIESLVTGDVNMGNIRQPAPAFSSVPNQTTNSPVFNISLGNFLGTETEFREFSRSIVKAYENYQKGAGESIVD